MIHILLINANPIVSRIFALSLHDTQDIHIDEISSYEPSPKDHYDILFIDEECCIDADIQSCVDRVKATKKILFATDMEHELDGIDKVITKPFLPYEVIGMIQSLDRDSEELVYENSTHLGDADTQKSIILDSAEIEMIKQLLLDDESIVKEDEEYILQSNATTKEEAGFEKRLLKSLTKMKPKKIRKLLSGAEVSISIKFPRKG